MEPEKIVKMQMQVRQNNDEMLSSFNDLNSWEEEIKAKEKSLSTGENLSEKPKNTFPIRNSILRKIKKDLNKQNDKTPAKNEVKKIQGSDYKAWENYDASEAVAEMDRGVQEEAEEMKVLAEQVFKQADLIKEEGNTHFKAGKYNDSVSCYTRAVHLTPHNPLLFSNRALAYIKLKRWSEAESDCDTALEMDGTMVKAMMRRGLVRREMGRLKEAREDFKQAVKGEPSNRQSRAELEKTQKQILETEAPKADDSDEEKAGIVKAIYKAPEERSKKPLWKVVIEEVGLERGEEFAEVHRKDLKSPNFNALLNNVKIDVINNNDNNDNNKNNNLNNKNNENTDINDEDDDECSILNDHLVLPGQRNVKIVELDGDDTKYDDSDIIRDGNANIDGNDDDDDDGDDETNKNNNNKEGVDKKNKKKETCNDKRTKSDAAANPKTSLSSPPTTTASSSPHKKSSSSPTISSSSSPTISPSDHQKSSFSTLTARCQLVLSSFENKFSQIDEGQSRTLKSPGSSSLPKISSFQFQVDWKALKDDDKGFFNYIKRVPPAHYRLMFGEFLDCSMLSKIIHTLKIYYVVGKLDSFDVLFHLTQVKRFTMISMFMNQQDRQALDEVFTSIRTSKLYASSQINQLSDLFQ